MKFLRQAYIMRMAVGGFRLFWNGDHLYQYSFLSYVVFEK